MKKYYNIKLYSKIKFLTLILSINKILQRKFVFNTILNTYPNMSNKILNMCKRWKNNAVLSNSFKSNLL